MGYLKIPNLYKATEILMFKEVYALSKIHGTSAHLKYNGYEGLVLGGLTYFSGGAKHEDFVKLFDHKLLVERFAELYSGDDIIVYGEAYGGKMQKMSHTYGPNLKFIVFDVKIGNSWLNVPQAEIIAISLGLDFVHYVKVSTDLEAINKERDRDSVQAIRNGMGEGHPEEGIVIRPLIELTKNNGERLIAKYKKETFGETKTPRPINESKLAILKRAQEIADEWVTHMRLNHVVDKLQTEIDTSNLPLIIPEMINDVKLESQNEVEWSKECEKAIGKATAKLVKGLVCTLN